MLQPNPVKRLSVAEVLRHPWLTNITELSNVPLGKDYVLRIKGLELRRKLKMGFQAGKIEENHKELKENFQEELTFLLDQSQLDKDKNELDMEANAILTSQEFQDNLKALKRLIMEKINVATGQEHLNNTEHNHQVYLTAPTLQKQRSSIYGEDINFEEFIKLVTKCDLECLATEKIFSIFDVSGCGFVNMKEFLFALIALKPFDPSGGGGEAETDASELYFHFFDINEDGYIGELN
jgi:hypothetical protein